jgi:hypothetical protein
MLLSTIIPTLLAKTLPAPKKSLILYQVVSRYILATCVVLTIAVE